MEIRPLKIDRMPFPPEELRVLADMAVKLTELRQNECKHLIIENFAPRLWQNLLEATYPPPMMIAEDRPNGIQGTDCPYGNSECPHCYPRSAMDEFADYWVWQEHCLKMNLDGPHRLVGEPPGWQFIDKSGTAAMWNERKRRGFVFRSAETVSGEI